MNTEKQNNDEQSDPFLASPKAFHLEMPLYRYFDLSNWEISKIIHDHMIFKKTIDAYCIWCKKEGVFKEHRSLYYHPSNPMWTPAQDGLNEIEFRCTRNSSHAYHSYYFKNGDVFAKVGQYPSVADFQIPQAKKYRNILGQDQYKELTAGIGLAAHGVGIGSFVYLRRVFENLIEEARNNAQKETEEFSNDDYVLARMDEKIKMVSNYLPEFLVENRSLYSILSKGIHELDEDVCLKYFETVKIGIEQILDEKIIQKERLEKAAKARVAIQQAHGKLNNK